MPLRWQIKSLMDPGGGGDDLLAGGDIGMRVWNDKVTLPLSNQETAECTISTTDVDAAAEAMSPYNKRLVCHLFDTPAGFDYPIFDGIITEPELKTETGEIVIKATDHSLRMANHFIRLGDRVLNGPSHPDYPNPYDGRVPLTGEGFRMIIEAAKNLPGNQITNYPPLGIKDNPGSDEGWDANPILLKFTRGDEVWQSLIEFASTQTAPEFQLIPLEGEDYYVELYTTVKRGLHDPVNNIWIPNSSTASAYINSGFVAGDDMPLSNAVFEAGFGKWNCEITHHPGGKVVSHVHTLSDKGQLRVTVHNPATAEDKGVYVHWEQTDFEADEDALRLRGREILAAYQDPVNNFELVPNGKSEYRFMQDYLVGSLIQAQYKSGLVTSPVMKARIMQVELSNSDQDAAGYQTSLTLLPDLGTVDLLEDA